MILRSRHHRRREVAELNITAFMNLMVILVPFLLITAVFSRLAILELNLPSSSTDSVEPPLDLQLEIIVREGAIEVSDRNSGRLKKLSRHDLEGQSAHAREKSQRVSSDRRSVSRRRV